MRLPSYRLSENICVSPHVVILGAGASRAAFPNGDATGRRLPVMADLIENAGLLPILEHHGIGSRSTNIEELYGSLHADGSRPEVLAELESAIADYFEPMRLPEAPTRYDELLLCLRPKDLIASFNWDPLLIQAFRRNKSLGLLPQIVFLHGNVGVGICRKDKQSDYAGHVCRVCGEPYETSPLLYPIATKRYDDDVFIQDQWMRLRNTLAGAYMLTVFGYGAPASDVEARRVMKAAWQQNATQELAQIEIVDVKPEAELIESWGEFIVRNHYTPMSDVSSSRIFRYVRRSCESLAWATLQNDPWRERRLPSFSSLADLHQWIRPLLEEEAANEASGAPLTRF